MQVNHHQQESALSPMAAAINGTGGGGGGGELQRLKMKRIKRGECPDCGLVLYKTTTGMLGRVMMKNSNKSKVPINEVGKCYAGRCLICVPLQPNETLPINMNTHNNNTTIDLSTDFFTDIQQQMQSTMGSTILPLDSIDKQQQQRLLSGEVTRESGIRTGSRLSPIPPSAIGEGGAAATEKGILQQAAPSGEAKKVAPVPRIILIYQNHRNQISNNSANDNDENRIDFGVLGLDLDDEVSEITLDRRIRDNTSTVIGGGGTIATIMSKNTATRTVTPSGTTTGSVCDIPMMGGDHTTTHHTYSHHDPTDYNEDTTSRNIDDDDDDANIYNNNKSSSFQAPPIIMEMSSPMKSTMNHIGGSTVQQQESYRNKMKQLFVLPTPLPSQQQLQELPPVSLYTNTAPPLINLDEPIHLRMARLLEMDVNGSSRWGSSATGIPEEEMDSKVYVENYTNTGIGSSAHPNVGGSSSMHGVKNRTNLNSHGNDDYKIERSSHFVQQQHSSMMDDRKNVSRRTLESAGDSIEGMDDDDDNNNNNNSGIMNRRRSSINQNSSSKNHEIKIGLDQMNFYEQKIFNNSSKSEQQQQAGSRSPMTNNNARRMQYYSDSGGTHNVQQHASHTSTKRIFQPKNVFVSQPLFDIKDLQSSSPNEINSIKNTNNVSKKQIHDLYVENPDNIFIARKPNIHVQKEQQRSTDILIERPEIHIERPDKQMVNEEIRFMDSSNENKSKLRDSRSQKSEGRRPPNTIALIQNEEITFGGGVVVGDDMNSRKSMNSSKPEIVFDLTALGEEQHTARGRGSNEESQYGYAGTENSSSHNEYSAYSSRLLMMLEGTDHDNDYSTIPSQRIPRIKADNDDLTNYFSHKSVEPTTSSNSRVTGNVFAETGIPKVVFSAHNGNDHQQINTEPLEMEGKENKPGDIPLNLSPLSSRLASRTIVDSTSVVSKSKTATTEGTGLERPLTSTTIPSMDEMEHLLVQLDKVPVKDCAPILFRLKELLLSDKGETTYSRQYFLEKNGAKILATTMWASMQFPRVEEATFELFFTLVTVDNLNELFIEHWNDDLSGLIDALLIAMQSIITDEEIQKVGCRIFCSLASQKGNENDGTRSGACLAVLNAMNTHSSSESVLEWGVRAIYNQCVCSKYADANKLIILTSNLDNGGSSGFELLEQIVRHRSLHMRSGGVMEWVYRLFWCLTASNKSVSDKLTFRMDSIRDILLMLEECRSTTDASQQLQEAVVGLIANLSRTEYFKSFLGTPDVVLLMQDTMRGNSNFVEVQIEGCNAIANISVLLSGSEKDELIQSGIIRTIVGALYAFPNQKNLLQDSALRAILGLSSESENAKAAICESKTLSVIMQSCRLDEMSTLQQQELLCKLLASLYASDRQLMNAIQSDTIGALSSALSTFQKSESITETGCYAYRNLSRSDRTFEALLRCNAIGFVVNAMATFFDSKSIQTNGCWVLWNLCAGTEVGPLKIAETDIMKHLVRTIQTHLDSYEVIDVACGALWSLIHRSNALRLDFLNIATGIESVICTLMMHLDKVPLLEKACGILAYSSKNLRAVPDEVVSSGVSNIVEVMINNPRSTIILQHGAHFLRNAISIYHRHADECTKVISVVMKVLKDSDVPVPFLGEILYFLWVISEISSDAKSKIISMEGIPMTMSVLDQFRGSRIPFVGDPALGLFQELSNESSTQRG